MNSFVKKFKELDSESILFEYQRYHLDRMNPDFYKKSKSDEILMMILMRHKDLHDKCVKMMIKKDINDGSREANNLLVDRILFLGELITHFESLEKFEACSKLKKIQDYYESTV